MHRGIAAAAVCGLLLVGCGSDDDEPSAAATAAAPAAAAAEPAAAASYDAVSDVSSNAAIGKDVAAIRALLEPAKPDFTAAAAIWSKGKFSVNGEGESRALSGFVEKHPAATGVADALAGTGSAAGLADEARVEMVDKGMIVALKVHALEEFEGAKEKLQKGELDPAEGAAHNVDEVWAYFDAEGEGVIATAAKRAVDFGLDKDALGDDVIAGITAAQAAVTAKDAQGLDAAAETTRGAMNRIFALAVKKYAVEGEKDATARAEGLAFSWGLAGEVSARDLTTIQAAFGKDAGAGAAEAVSDALDAAKPKLGITAELPAYPPASS